MPTFECPTCSKSFTVAQREDATYRPFCCRRCKLVDLGRWFDGTYTISDPTRPDDVADLEDLEERDGTASTDN